MYCVLEHHGYISLADSGQKTDEVQKASYCYI